MNPNLKVPPKSKFFKKKNGEIYFINTDNEYFLIKSFDIKIFLSYIAAWEFQVAMNKLLSNCVKNTQEDWDNLKKYYEQQKAWLKWGKCK